MPGKPTELRVTFTFDEQIAALEAERERLLRFPEEEFIAIIREVGFSCDCCGRCCTREFNDHVFLLGEDTDTVRSLLPDAVIPRPRSTPAIRRGRFYVSGYALRTKPDGSCIFLEDGRCSIYDRRFAICRVYPPYMLHREADETGAVDWRQIGGLNQHGSYNNPIDDAECVRIARETRAYEAAFLEQEIRFRQALRDLFDREGLRYVRRTYDLLMRDFRKGAEVEVRVFHRGGRFEPHRVTRDVYGQ
ncbi:YkgJ family cysteine cluster protein [Methanoculleus chikugoensis]|uniref:YkgJ family cysteine cluster protein n=1 Tax=Methanoculleus chikugoensis TaxID=118126 RepID=UPI0006D21947|nr:YkgJ family cysteine cluster protein [Methanoculleus chikugoensis]